MLFVRADDKKYGDSDLANRFDNRRVVNADEQNLGKVDKVFVNLHNRQDIYLEADLGGGFLGFGAKEFLLPAGKLGERSDGDFFLDLPEDETKMQGRLVPGDGQAHLAGILAPPYGYAEGQGEGIKEAIGGPTGQVDSNFAAHTGDYAGRRTTSAAVLALQDKLTSLKGNRLYESGSNEQYGTIEEVYCDLSNGEPKLVKVRYGGDAQPGGFFSLFGSGYQVLLSLDAIEKRGDYYFLRDPEAIRVMHAVDEDKEGKAPTFGL